MKAEEQAGAKKIGLDEIKCHYTNGDCWIIVNKKVYDVSTYMANHPGGFDIIL